MSGTTALPSHAGRPWARRLAPWPLAALLAFVLACGGEDDAPGISGQTTDEASPTGQATARTTRTPEQATNTAAATATRTAAPATATRTAAPATATRTTAPATATRAPATATPTADRAGCDPSYPTVCIPPPPPDLDCGDIRFRRFQVLRPDPHRFDADGNGIGCEAN